jgi:hypothetical protein
VSFGDYKPLLQCLFVAKAILLQVQGEGAKGKVRGVDRYSEVQSCMQGMFQEVNVRSTIYQWSTIMLQLKQLTYVR